VFAMQWLLTAQKRKLFPKSVAPDIMWLLAQGKKYGFGANLLKKRSTSTVQALGNLLSKTIYSDLRTLSRR
jgi:hypothetical protein